jgi:3-hydroxyisobutyrate dehydrogenase-like beta-hydroxyacid dehydrogenase
MKTAIAVLGIGRMGSALARALIRADFHVRVWNRTADKCAPLAALGATAAATVPDAVADSDIVLVNVSDYDATRSLLRRDDVAPLLTGKLIVELTSGTPKGAREASSWAGSRDASYLDGAILATPDYIGTDAGTILVSGPVSLFHDSQDFFHALGGNVQHVGDDPGRANAMDLSVLSLMWGTLFGALQSIAICKAEAIPLPDLATQWTATAPVIEGLVNDLIGRTGQGRFAADADSLSTIAPHFSAFQNLRELVNSHGVDPGLVNAYDAVFRRAIAAGQEQDDFAAMSLHLGRPA